jgi:hypothetical protein
VSEAQLPLAQFRGAVHCRRDDAGPLGLTLSGRTAEHPEEELLLAFTGAAPADLPERLDDARVETGGPGEYRIAAGAREWRLTARSVHWHRDLGGPFYRAIPGRPAPLLRRVIFSAMLTLARSRFGMALLRRARR